MVRGSPEQVRNYSHHCLMWPRPKVLQPSGEVLKKRPVWNAALPARQGSAALWLCLRAPSCRDSTSFLLDLERDSAHSMRECNSLQRMYNLLNKLFHQGCHTNVREVCLYHCMRCQELMTSLVEKKLLKLWLCQNNQS